MTATVAPATSPLDVPGGPLLELAVRAPESTRPIVGELLQQLRVACGSAERATCHGYLTTSPSGWRTLRQVPARELVDAIRRTEWSWPAFRLPGSDQQPVHVRVEHFLARMEER
jgi:hypothetical protein